MENQKYITEFCNYHGVFENEFISQRNMNKISYNFGVDQFYLSNIKNLKQLNKTIKKHAQIFPPVVEDINSELLQMLRLKK
jgi:hypothetical protein